MQFSPADVFAAGMRHHAIANTAWPIAHGKTMRPYIVGKNDRESHILDGWSATEDMCLYVHVPFCEKICKFCDYSVMNPDIRNEQEPKYFEYLDKELDIYQNAFQGTKKNCIGFDIGGWTPSSVDVSYIDHIVDRVRRDFSLAVDTNISIETTPKIASENPEKIRAYHDMGIRRISMGVQTIAPESVGRESTSLLWNREAMRHIREAGFEQMNIDLMYWFAGQSTRHVGASIEHILSLDPEFVTLYRMRYKRTNVEDKATHVQLEAVNRQYDVMKDMLGEAGYEVRNGKNTFSKLAGNDGLSDYLHHRVERAVPYLGIGMGAQSFHPGHTLSYNGWAAIKHPDYYYRNLENWHLPVESLHHLSREAAMAKMIAVSFYSGGIHRESFQKAFGITLEQAFPEEVRFVKEQWYMVDDDKYGTLQLTALGNRFYSGVIALFYNGEVKKYLLETGENEWMHGTNMKRPIQTTVSLK